MGDWVNTYRVLVPFRHKGRVFEWGDVVDEDELPIEEILAKRPDLVTFYGGRRRRTTNTGQAYARKSGSRSSAPT